MPLPVPGPSEFKALIPSTSASLCEKFLRFLRQFPQKFYEQYSFEWTEDGEFTEEYKAALCEVTCECLASGGSGTGTLAAPTISATDGAFSNKVVVSWALIAAATLYDVWRSTSNDSTGAVLIGSTASGSYDDSSVTPGQVMFYWVKSRNATLTSAFSGSDSGYAAGSIVAATDLVASKGFSPFGSQVYLKFSKVSGASTYDFFRGTVNDFTDSGTTKIGSDRVPFDTTGQINSCYPIPCTQAPFTDVNGTTLVYTDSVPNTLIKFYYWVVAKQTSGGNVLAVSTESNSAVGWAFGNPDESGLSFNAGNITSGFAEPITAGTTRLWVVLFGNSGSGAGGSTTVGGGGGGGGAVGWGVVDVTGGGWTQLRVVSSPESDLAGGAGSTNGVDAGSIILQLSTNGADWVDAITATGAGKGVYAGGGGGAGGAGGTAVIDGAYITDGDSEPGEAGEAGSGSRGGRGGLRFGSAKTASGNHVAGSGVNDWGEGDLLSNSGGGSYAVSPGASATGGGAVRGFATFYAYA